MNERHVVKFRDHDNGQSAIDNLNGYCCNEGYVPIQIIVIVVDEPRSIRDIYAIVEKI